jgi:hypothetical protein
VPVVPVPGVPDRRPPALSVTPEGNADGVQDVGTENAVLEKVGAGYPLAATWKLPAVPTVKVVELPVVMVGACLTVSVTVLVEVDPA